MPLCHTEEEVGHVLWLIDHERLLAPGADVVRLSRISARDMAIARSSIKATQRFLQMVVHQNVAKRAKSDVLATLVAACAAREPCPMVRSTSRLSMTFHFWHTES